MTAMTSRADALNVCRRSTLKSKRQGAIISNWRWVKLLSYGQNPSQEAKITRSAANRVDPGSLFDYLSDAYIVLDEDRVAVFANQAYYALVEQSRESTVGRSVLALPLFRALTMEPAGEAWLQSVCDGLTIGRTSSTPSFRFDLPPLDGGKSRRHFWKLKASRIPSGPEVDQCATGYLALRVSDVTERVEREIIEQREKARLRSQAQLRQIVANETAARLRAHQEQFATALAFAKVGAWELAPRTGLITCTEQCKLNLGLQPDDLLSEQRLFGELIAPEFRADARARMETALAEQRHFETEYRVTSFYPAERWLLVRGQGKFGEDGTLIAILGFTIDITARKKTELEQKRLTAVEREAREESDRYAESMDHFVSAVTHELRSPLSAITSWSELLTQSKDANHLSQAAAALKRNARQLSLMVDDLLDTGAIVSGKLSVNRSPVVLELLVQDVLRDQDWEAHREGVALTSELASCRVMGDESRIKQIVWNLMSNAIKFTQQGKITVTLRRDKAHAILEVQDTGCGIDASALPRVFDRFEQVRTDVAGRIGGLGLGLWLVKSLVEMHGGTVEAESAGSGHGCLFRVSLPLLTAEELPNVA
jgi:PAS domain S-box-containing protein